MESAHGFSSLEWKGTKLVFKILKTSMLDFIHSANGQGLYMNNIIVSVSSAIKWKLSSFEMLGKLII